MSANDDAFRPYELRLVAFDLAQYLTLTVFVARSRAKGCDKRFVVVTNARHINAPVADPDPERAISSRKVRNGCLVVIRIGSKDPHFPVYGGTVYNVHIARSIYSETHRSL